MLTLEVIESPAGEEGNPHRVEVAAVGGREDLERRNFRRGARVTLDVEGILVHPLRQEW